MKTVYVYVPHLPVQVELGRRGNESIPNGLVIVGRPWNPDVVLDCSAEVEDAGVQPGMPQARARLRCPDAHFLTADHRAYQVAQESLEAALRNIVDRVETAGLGEAYLDANGVSQRFPKDKDLIRAIVDAVHKIEPWDLLIGLAERRFTAEQAALTSTANRGHVIPAKRGRRFLAPLPLTVLPADREFVRRLGLLHIRTLRDLAALPRNALIRQFDEQAGFLHDLAADADPRSVQPDAPPLELRCQRTFEPPTFVRDFLHVVIGQMNSSLCQTMDRQGYQAQGLRIEIIDSDDIAHTTATSIEPPTADEAKLTRRARFLVDRLKLEHPAENIEIIIYPLRPRYLGANQLALFSANRDHRIRKLQEALRRIRERFGEFVVMIASLIRPPGPRPIDVVTDVEQQPRTLVWKSQERHQVSCIYEHWRERRDWWAQPVLRDYYRLEDASGVVRIVFQDLATQRWWLDRRV